MSKTKRDQATQSNSDNAVQKVEYLNGHWIKNAIDGKLEHDYLTSLRDEITNCHAGCMAVGTISIRANILCGEMLMYAKSIVGHGNFDNWIKENFSLESGLCLRTAQRYMAKARKFRKFLTGNGIHLEANTTAKSFLEQDDLLRQFLGTAEPTRKTMQFGDEWGTPTQLINALLSAIARIDCDPCVSEHFSAADRATATVYDETTDGLSDNNAWTGNVFVAPGTKCNPYPWLVKGNRELMQGNIESATFLIPAVFTPELAEQLTQSLFCILNKRLKVQVWNSTHVIELSLPDPIAIVFMGSAPLAIKFAESFQSLGRVYWPHKHEGSRTVIANSVSASSDTIKSEAISKQI